MVPERVSQGRYLRCAAVGRTEMHTLVVAQLVEAKSSSKLELRLYPQWRFTPKGLQCTMDRYGAPESWSQLKVEPEWLECAERAPFKQCSGVAERLEARWLDPKKVVEGDSGESVEFQVVLLLLSRLAAGARWPGKRGWQSKGKASHYSWRTTCEFWQQVVK